MKKQIQTIFVMAMAIGMMFGILAGDASAWESCRGKVTEIEPAQMPASLLFKKDCYTPSCPTSYWVYYTGSPSYGSAADNTKAIYATTLSAIVAGRNVDFYLSDGACTALTIHILQ